MNDSPAVRCSFEVRMNWKANEKLAASRTCVRNTRDPSGRCWQHQEGRERPKRKNAMPEYPETYSFGTPADVCSCQHDAYVLVDDYNLLRAWAKRHGKIYQRGAK